MSQARRASTEHGLIFWYYNNWDFNPLGSIYERAAETTIFEAFTREIAAAIGMQDVEADDTEYRGGRLSTTGRSGASCG